MLLSSDKLNGPLRYVLRKSSSSPLRTAAAARRTACVSSVSPSAAAPKCSGVHTEAAARAGAATMASSTRTHGMVGDEGKV
eukprot:3109749-Prymnesium_polylepis.2